VKKITENSAFFNIKKTLDRVSEKQSGSKPPELYPSAKHSCTCGSLRSRIEELEAQLDANKNCLNCGTYFFRGNEIICRITGKAVVMKICDKWSQL
jgi:hypothetical protein